MDLLSGKLGSSNSSLDGNDVTSVEAERVPHVTGEEDKEPTTIPVIKTEPNVSSVPVVHVTHISYWLHPELPSLYQCVLGKQKFDSGKWILSSF
jgi:hypothetical protein